MWCDSLTNSIEISTARIDKVFFTSRSRSRFTGKLPSYNTKELVEENETFVKVEVVIGVLKQEHDR